MSSEGATSRGTASSQCSGIPRLRCASLGLTKELFATLDLYYHDAFHSAALNMAIDEAVLQSATVPSIRFYRWQSPALSFGYFGKFADVAMYIGERDQVFAKSSISIYEGIHRALCAALNGIGEHAIVAGSGEPSRIVTAKQA